MFLYWSKPLSDPTESGLIGATKKKIERRKKKWAAEKKNVGGEKKKWATDKIKIKENKEETIASRKRKKKEMSFRIKIR